MTFFVKQDKTPVKITGVLFLFFLSVMVHAQESVIQSDFEHKVNLYDVNGKPWVNSNIDVTGSPFFKDEWTDGKLFTTKASDGFLNGKVRLNLHTNQLHLLDSNKIEIIIPQGVVREVLFHDSSVNNNTVIDFQSGFPAIENKNQYTFYKVIVKGKIWFVQSLWKSISVEKDAFTGTVNKEFVLHDDYYIFSQLSMYRFKKGKDFILSLLPDKKAEINTFISQNSLACKTTDDIKKIIGFYNSLP